MVTGPCISRLCGLGTAGGPSKSTRAQGLAIKYVLPLFLATIAGVIPAHCADFTIHVGGLVPGALKLNNARLALDGSPVVGVRFANNFVRVLGLEHTLAFSPDFLQPEGGPDQNVKGFIYNSNLVVNVPLDHAIPYITFGLGIITPFGSDTRLFGTKFAVNYGGGLKFPHLAGPIGLRFDARGYSASGVFSGNLRLLEPSGGLFFTLGR